MRKSNRVLLTALAAVSLLAAGGQITATAGGTTDPNAGYPINSYTDATGRITVTVYSRTSEVGHVIRDHVVTPRDGDMVAVGGGATASNQGYGSLLTASQLFGHFAGWQASSKDHLQGSPHRLTTYVIGMKIAGMSANELRSNLKLQEDQSGVMSHPEAEAGSPGSESWVLLGGGFRADYHGAGNMATASFPATGHSWKSRSKDHIAGDPANLYSWGVYLRRHLRVGQVLQHIPPPVGSAFTGHPSATANVPDGYVMTGGGAEVKWQGEGNLLWQLEPTANGSRGFRASAKDHLHNSSATLHAYVVGIRMA
ncbi:hypothetical protein [Crossiella sp. NPDC003009]